MSVRKLFRTGSSPADAQALLSALVHAAVYIGSADGRFSEEELDVFIDTMREVVSSAGGPEFLSTLASTAALLDQARKARSALRSQGESAYLAHLAPQFESEFVRPGLVLAYRIIIADGAVSTKEEAAFEALAKTLNVPPAECATLKQLATVSEAASQRGHRGQSIELFRQLTEHGWRPFPTKEKDVACLRHEQSPGGWVELELNSSESSLHLSILDAQGQGPQLLCLFHDTLPALLSVIDEHKDALSPASYAMHLPKLRAACSHLFVEYQGRWS